MSELERRVVRGTVALREDSSGTPTLQGYAAVFNSETVIGTEFREVIAPGAFSDAIQHDDVRGLFNHDSNFVLGRTKSGTLRLGQDATGLRYTIDMPDTQVGRDVLELVRRGDLDGSSFAFIVPPGGDDWNRGGGQLPLRTIRKVQLFDVSPVTYPAYPDTSVQVSARARAAATLAANEVQAMRNASKVLSSCFDCQRLKTCKVSKRDGRPRCNRCRVVVRALRKREAAHVRRFVRRRAAARRDDVVPRRSEVVDEVRSDEARRPGDEADALRAHGLPATARPVLDDS